MDILPLAFYQNLKRFLQGKKYQRLNSPSSSSSSHSRKKVKIARLGGCRTASRLHCKGLSGSIKCVVKFPDVYVDVMVCAAQKIVNRNSFGGLLGGRRAAKAREFALVSPSEEVVDCTLVMEMYKKLVASRRLSSFDELL